MGLELADIEGIALADYREHGIDPRRPPGGPALAQALIGRRCLPRGRWRAHLRPANDGPEIHVPWRLSDARYNEHTCHEIAEKRLRDLGYREPDVEAQANALGACYAVPRPAFQRAWRKFGRDLAQLAAYFIVTQSLVALRFGEVLGTSCALVTPEKIHRRGQPHLLPEDSELRRFTRSHYYPGLELVPLSDLRRRWLVVYVGI